MVKPIDHPNYPWFGMFVGVFVLGSFYWSMDQVLVQRAFAARSLDEGRKGAIFCGFLKLTTPFLLVLPGVVAKALYPGLAKPDHAYPTLLRELMPHGLLGLTVAGIAAALMGHISATYNSVATLVTRDFYLGFWPDASPERQVRFGRLSVLAVCILGAAWAPLIGLFGNLLDLPADGAGVPDDALRRDLLRRCPVAPHHGPRRPRLPRDRLRRLPDVHGRRPVALPAVHGSPLLRPWLHAAFVAFLVCMAVLVAVSLASPRPGPRRDSRRPPCAAGASSSTPEPAELAGNYLFWLGLLLASCTGLWILMR